LCRENDITLRWTVFPLHPETPDEGQTLENLFGGRMDIPKAMAELQTIATDLGVPFGHRTHTYNSRRAQELGKWAEQHERGDDFRTAVYRAYFADGKNIADVDVLVGLCRELGLPQSEARDVLEQRLFASVVDDDWHRVAQFGVKSVPSRIYQNRLLVGYQPADKLKQLLGK
jgi:predicted DsbA family dithiol-disulfide isomerase